MSLEAILLAFTSTLRPTGIAAVYALVCAPDFRRCLIAFIAVGFTWSIGIGILVVEALHGVEVNDGPVTDVVDVVGGVVALWLAFALASGRLSIERAGGSPRRESGLVARLRNPTMSVAAAAGVLTHLPGLFYLLGLNAIVATDPDSFDGIVAVLIFNAIWFLTPAASLLLSIRRPEQTREALSRVNAWIARHQHLAVITVLTLVGLYFTLRGVTDLLA